MKKVLGADPRVVVVLTYSSCCCRTSALPSLHSRWCSRTGSRHRRTGRRTRGMSSVEGQHGIKLTVNSRCFFIKSLETLPPWSDQDFFHRDFLFVCLFFKPLHTEVQIITVNKPFKGRTAYITNTLIKNKTQFFIQSTSNFFRCTDEKYYRFKA